MDEQGNFVDPHHIFALVLRYLVETRGWSGAVVKTVSTTMMVNRLAEKSGLPLHETPVGFNHIAKLILNDDVLMGGEESGGLSIKGHIPEGDGVLMGLLLLEVIAQAGVPLSELVTDIQKVAGPTCYTRKDLRLSHPVIKSDMVNRLKTNPPSQLAGVQVDELCTQDGVKYRLADDSWLLIRPSGTEPVLCVYAEAPEQAMVDELLAYGQEIANQVK
jgi:phosphomannomutase